ncbi:MAG TPA: hypothetical protein V6C50_07015, partial [Crinalium sp.]
LMTDDRTSNRCRASSHEIDLQALDRGILLATLSRGLSGSLGRNLETSQRPLSIRFLECDRFSLT